MKFPARILVAVRFHLRTMSILCKKKGRRWNELHSVGIGYNRLLKGGRKFRHAGWNNSVQGNFFQTANMKHTRNMRDNFWDHLSNLLIHIHIISHSHFYSLTSPVPGGGNISQGFSSNSCVTTSFKMQLESTKITKTRKFLFKKFSNNLLHFLTFHFVLEIYFLFQVERISLYWWSRQLTEQVESIESLFIDKLRHQLLSIEAIRIWFFTACVDFFFGGRRCEF